MSYCTVTHEMSLEITVCLWFANDTCFIIEREQKTQKVLSWAAGTVEL